jgi:crossover junction endodeoxyribonuclease RuvC
MRDAQRLEPLNPRQADRRQEARSLLTGEGALIDVVDMPCLAAGAARRRALNAPLVADILAKTHASHAFVELVGARPVEGPAGAFSFGKSLGTIEGVLATLSIPQTLITPAAWKRTLGIPPGKEGAKDRARAEAIRRWPPRPRSSPASGRRPMRARFSRQRPRRVLRPLQVRVCRGRGRGRGLRGHAAPRAE